MISTTTAVIIAVVATLLGFALAFLLFKLTAKGKDEIADITKALEDVLDEIGEARKDIDDIDRAAESRYKNIAERVRENGQLVRDGNEGSRAMFSQMEKSIASDMLSHQNDAMRTQNEMLTSFRQDIGSRIDKLSETNASQLAEMRNTVDAKLQKTLDEKLQNSFSAVVDQLTKVQEGLGTMQSLANDVGGLKKVLSNVKTRGTLGEIQLGAILQEVLSPEQYDENVVTVKGSNNPVEYAVKMPGQGEDGFVYLPIDSKFPMDAYQTLLDAYDDVDAGGEKTSVLAAWKTLEARLKQEAKDIHEKYTHVPETTEFAVMFLPTEGLYAETVRRGMVEVLQRDYRVMIAGPTTMAALLNSLQMGFRTLAIQKSSNEVWQVLGNVKSEFAKFEDALTQAQKRIRQADEDIDKLVGTRTRMMNRRLAQITISGATENDAELFSAPTLPMTTE